jgi:hypothetical protein
MENDGSNEFIKQFGGSAAANVVFAVGLLLYKFIEGRCKHSRCSSNLSWCRCNVDNYETERAESNKDIKNAVRSQESVQAMFRRDNQIVQEKHIETLELRAEESIEGSARDSILVKGEDAV